MYRRVLVLPILAVLIFGLGACSNKKVKNPLAEVDSKQPDKVLYDRAMEAMKRNRFEVARSTLKVLLDTYPDSEFVARAKLSLGDSWYAEGGTAALAQAEAEYRDFTVYFPQMLEASEAQMKIANIHYQQMEKPDRDFTHAKRAEDEYRQMIQQYPDSPLVPQAKAKLREVQEVLAEREFRIGRFYYLREAWPAAIARLKSVAEAYPLYSGAGEALFLLGDAYQRQEQIMRANLNLAGSKVPADIKARLLKDSEDQAANAYSRILTRYPVTDRAVVAKARLEAMKRPVPTATAEAIAQNKAEEESRRTTGMVGGAWLNFRKAPDMARTSRVGEPSLTAPEPVSAAAVAQRPVEIMGSKGSGTVTVETVGKTAPPPNQAVPRSDSSESTGIPELKPLDQAGAESKPAAAPAQQNQIPKGDGEKTPTAQGSDPAKPAEAKTGEKGDQPDTNESSSRTKKKKGIRKVLPF